MTIEKFNQESAPSLNLPALNFFFTFTAIYENSYLTPEELIKILDIKVEQISTKTNKDDELIFSRDKIFLRKCENKDFEFDGQFIVDKMDKSSAKYAVCLDLSKNENI